MIYVMTGLRGDFKKYVELKNSLIMKKSDDLYLVGGILGGSGGIDILLDAMSEENVFPIAGKDELLALKYLDFMKNNDKSDDLEIKKGMADWFKNGGYPTAEAFTKLDEEDKEAYDMGLNVMEMSCEVAIRAFVDRHVQEVKAAPNATTASAIFALKPFKKLFFFILIKN